MNDFGLLLKKLRKSKGLNQDDLAQVLGVRKTTISNYETGYSAPSSAMLRQIAEFFGIAVSELLGETPLMQEVALSDTVPIKQIPVFSSLPTANFSAYAPIYMLDMPASFVGEGDFFGLKISGERMDRSRLHDGSVAIIRKQEFVDDGDVAAVAVGENPVIVIRFYRVGENIVLISESNNPVYRPMIFKAQEEPIVILGKVIKSIETVI